MSGPPPSKLELIGWLQSKYQYRGHNLESCKTGVMFLHVLNHMFPKVPLAKMEEDPKNQHDYTKNMNLVMKVLGKQRIQHRFRPEKLVAGSYRECLEFLQMLKILYDSKGMASTQYSCELALQNAGRKSASKAKTKKRSPSSASTSSDAAKSIAEKAAKIRQASAVPKKKKPKQQAQPANVPALSLSKTAPSLNRKPQPQSARTASSGSVLTPRSAAAMAWKGREQQIKEMVAGLADTLTGMEEERDGYFAKLRAIEVVCEDEEAWADGPACRERIQRLLYALAEDVDVLTGQVPPRANETDEKGDAAATTQDEDDVEYLDTSDSDVSDLPDDEALDQELEVDEQALKAEQDEDDSTSESEITEEEKELADADEEADALKAIQDAVARASHSHDADDDAEYSTDYSSEESDDPDDQRTF